MNAYKSFWAILSLLISLVSAGGVSYTTVSGRKQCTVTANGGNQSDVANLLHAFSECGHAGNIIFPENQNYWIDHKLNPVLNDVYIDWKGIWTVIEHSITLHVLLTLIISPVLT